jgi:hypothetical protein
MINIIPSSIQFTVTIGLEDGKVSFSFSPMQEGQVMEQSTQEKLDALCQKAITGIIGVGLTKLVERERVVNAVTYEMQKVSDFAGVMWKDPNGWAAFNERSDESGQSDIQSTP